MVKVLHIVVAHDVGKAINPMLVEGQIEGGIAQGLGLALMEDYVPGRTENLHDYLIPTIGEQALIPTAPAILLTIRHAIGVTLHQVPATPDRIRSVFRAANEDKL